MKKPAYLVTCEHGGNQVPAAYSQAFAMAEADLSSHRGYDPGALSVARALSRALNSKLCYSETTRLLIDLNRSLNNPEVWSEYSRGLPADEIMATYYFPYRNEVESMISELIASHGRVIHLSIHSFTPVWKGEKRTTDMGILFDDDRAGETAYARRWIRTLNKHLNGFQTDLNKPYLGKDDGFTTYLRTKFPDGHYLGIELEINQQFAPKITEMHSRLIASVLDIDS
ncbi:MAG: N-formylglutamate amidohydrolase [Cyclobacteriaceae bacterium]